MTSRRRSTRPNAVEQTKGNPRPVRVCFMIDDLGVAGTESQLVRLIGNLNRERVVPFLCLLRGEDGRSRALEPPNCPVLRLGVRSLHQVDTLFKALQLARFLRREGIDILQVYFPDSSYLGVPVGRLAGVRQVVRVRNNLNHWMTPAHHMLGRLCNRLVTVTAANCEACRQAVLADERLPAKSVVVLENGVDLERFLEVPSLASQGKIRGTRRVGVVANLRPVKGLDVFVRAAALLAAAHADVRFEIAGEGEQRLVLEGLAHAAGLGDRLVLHGSVQDIPGFLAGLDVGVLCSRSEGMPNAVLEYMAAGRAIVATAVGATPQLLQDGVHGLLVPPEDPEALARAVGRLLEDRELASRLGAAARRRASARFSREAMVRRFEMFYLQLGQRHC